MLATPRQHPVPPEEQVSGAEADALEARLRGINSMAQIVRAQRAAVGVDYVLGVGGFDLERVEGEVRRSRTLAACNPSQCRCACGGQGCRS
jgi:G3E family GTPase